MAKGITSTAGMPMPSFSGSGVKLGGVSIPVSQRRQAVLRLVWQKMSATGTIVHRLSAVQYLPSFAVVRRFRHSPTCPLATSTTGLLRDGLAREVRVDIALVAP